ncbi:MAG: site-2 protease family protein [Alphaproteobacteria bacterium]|nr:site-2 protease family protein [Alphaproteobacteria bacterium]
MQDLFSDASTLVAIAVPIIIAITFHEAAHGIVAWRLGDDTAYVRGRVTLNPLKHIDAFGTILLPALLLLTKAPFLFGWAKPVPVNFGRLHHPRRDMVLVAAAGPATNVLLAVVSALLLHFVVAMPESLLEPLSKGIQASIWINALLAVFNMLPLPPLDGGRVAVGLLPDQLAFPLAKLERWGLFILIGVLFIVPLIGDQIGLNLSPFEWVILPVVDLVIQAVLGVTGVA